MMKHGVDARGSVAHNLHVDSTKRRKHHVITDVECLINITSSRLILAFERLPPVALV